MRTIIAPLAGVVALICGAGTAWAASPAYCALYAKEFVRHAAVDSQGSVPGERIHDRAYHKCLNLDDEPTLPTAYSDPRADGIGGPFITDQGSTEAMNSGFELRETVVDEDIVKETAAIEPPQSTGSQRTGKWQGSGFAMWSSEWREWCASHFPNSFNPKTGTIVPFKTGARTVCR